MELRAGCVRLREGCVASRGDGTRDLHIVRSRDGRARYIEAMCARQLPAQGAGMLQTRGAGMRGMYATYA